MDFFIGGVSAMCAGFFSNPFDVIKTRQQLQGELQKQANTTKQPYRGLLNSVRSIVRAEGLFGLQKGLGPALSFQFVLNSTRLGLFQTADNFGWTKWRGGEHSPFLCFFWGGVSGVAGSFFGCPLYLLKTQFQSKSIGEYAVGFQHDHKSTMQGLTTIVKQHGFKGLWRGYTSLVSRVAVGSSVQLATFSTVKDFFLQYEIYQKSTFFLATSSSMISGFCTVLCMTPFDTVATRMFNQGVDVNGRGLLYRNLFDCFIKTFKIEGLRGLYKGFTPNYIRTAPHTVLNLTFWEQFKKWKDVYFPNEREMYLD